MKESTSCQSCGTLLESGAPDGICPSCLLGGGFMDEDEDPNDDIELIVEKPGDLIGRYKLLEKIGEGGFGVVFRAEQQVPVTRIVALKVIKPGMDSKQVISRFEAERQALALMDHPNISKIYDAGTTEWGRPYFVMEYVEGRPLTAFCDQEKLNIKDRLKLFLRICAAVQHAHQKGVIHRDLKPSNVLVSQEQDGDPFPKVIDFGVAKSISMELTKETLYTLFGRLVGTPQYMSPEQAELNAVDVDTRSDIYSLGVLLYELVTGLPPIEEESLTSKGMDEVRRIIREEEPLKPSSRIFAAPDEQRRSAAEARGIEPLRYRRHLEGDLDWIVMKALEKDRNRRYDTAQGLALDVRRYLKGLPVSAGPPGATYRMRKFVRRHRVGSITTALVLLALIIGAGLFTKGYFKIQNAHEETTIEKNRAEKFLQEKEYERLTGMVEHLKTMRAEEPGSREQALKDLAEVGAYLDGLTLEGDLKESLIADARNELIFCLDWKDLRPKPLFEGLKEGDVPAALDSIHERCALFRDGRLEVRETSSGAILKSHPVPGIKIAGPLRFSPKGEWVAAGFGSPEQWELVLWSWKDNRFLELPEKLRGSSGAFSFHPEGIHPKEIFFAIGYSTHGVCTIEFFANDGSQPRDPITIQGKVGAMQFSPDDPRFLAVGLEDGGVTVVDLEAVLEHEQKWTLAVGLKVASLAWAPDGHSLAVGGTTGEVTILNLDSGDQVPAEPKMHRMRVDQIVWSHDGRLIASGSGERITNLWDGRQCAHLCESPAWARTLSFSGDDQWLGPVTPSERKGLNRLKVERSLVCHRAQGHRAQGHQAQDLRGHDIQATVWTPNKLVLVTAARDGLRFWNREGILLDHHPEPGISNRLGGLACSGRGLYIVTDKGIAHRSLSFSDEHLQVGDSEVFYSMVANGAQMILGPDEEYLAVANDTEVILLNCESGDRIHSDKLLDAPKSTAFLAISPDGQWLAAGPGEGGSVRVWAMKSEGGKGLSIGPGTDLPLKMKGRTTVAFNPLPREKKNPYEVNLLTGDAKTYRLWRWIAGTNTWNEEHRQPSETAKRLPLAVYSPRDTVVVTSFDYENIQVLLGKNLQLMTQPGFVDQRPLSISPDGRLLATTSRGGQLFLWNLKEVIEELVDKGLGFPLPSFSPEKFPLILPDFKKLRPPPEG